MLQASFFVVCGLLLGVQLPVFARSYPSGASLSVIASELSSSRTLIPMDWWAWKGSAGCIAATRASASEQRSASLGAMLTGRETVSTPFVFPMNQRQNCAVVCEEELSPEVVQELASLIGQDYVSSVFVDGLPAATGGSLETGGLVTNFHMGRKILDTSNVESLVIHNHWTFTVEVIRSKKHIDKFEVVGLSLAVSSRQGCGTTEAGELTTPLPQAGVGVFTRVKMPWLMSVEFIEDTSGLKTHRNRLNAYVGQGERRMHWFSFFNSSVVALVLAVLTAGVLLRALNRDIAFYNGATTAGLGVIGASAIGRLEEGVGLVGAIAGTAAGTAGSSDAETGWKLIHGDVFRAPPYRRWFCVLVGTGAQVFVTLAVVLFMAAVGAVDSGNSVEKLVQAGLVVYAVAGYVNGYVVARLLKLFGSQDFGGSSTAAGGGLPRRTVFLACTFFPGLFLAGVAVVDVILAVAGSSGAVPFSGLLALLVLWLGIHSPLTFIGASVGAREETIAIPCSRVNAIPRPLSMRRPWFSKSYILYGIGGILPFGAIFTELYYILNAITTHEYHTIYGLFLLVFFVYAVTAGLVSVVLTYCTLIAEDYRWWFRSFVVCGSSGVYVFLYGLVFLDNRLGLGVGAGSLVYLVKVGLLGGIAGMVAGFAGFAATFLFVKTIYGSIKVE